MKFKKYDKDRKEKDQEIKKLKEHISEMSHDKPATLLKNRLWHRWFPANFVKFLKTPFFTEHLQ